MLEPDALLQGRYRVLRALGRGGMGAVYLATDETFGSAVAIKQTLCEGTELEKAFQREARLLNTLRHGALPVVIDYFSEARGQFLVMQYIPGEDFGALLEQRSEPFAPDQVVAWADQLLEALQYLHEHDPQVIHRDIKPRNLKLTPRGEVVLLDFGLSKSTPVESQVAGTSVSVLGYTPHYAPFEQIQGQGTDPRSDLFSLAATLYHLLTATLPPDAMVRALTTMNGQADPLEPVHVVNPAVPVAIGTIVHQAMAMGRDQRPESAAAMRAALVAAQSAASQPVSRVAMPVDAASPTVASLPAMTAPPRRASEPAATASRARRWVAAASVLLLVGGIALVLALPGRIGFPAPRLPASAPSPAAADQGLAFTTIAPAERTFAYDAVTLDPKGVLARHDKREGRSYTEDLGGGVAIEMVAIPGGRFLMGSSDASYPDEVPQHDVAIAPFYLSRYEVTQAQWRAVATTLPRVSHQLAPEPAAYKGDDLPVEQVSWEDAMEFCARLSRKARHRYRMPSEAEWEYAARAGTATAFAFGDTLTPTLASYDASVPFGDGPRGPAPTQTSPVGSFVVANAFGLSDMHGNVSEWCIGEYHPSYEGAPRDGRPWLVSGDVERHVIRGGSWDDLAVDCRSANRYSYPRTGRQRTIGFRLAMALESATLEAQPPAATPAAVPVAAVPSRGENVEMVSEAGPPARREPHGPRPKLPRFERPAARIMPPRLPPRPDARR